MSWIDRINNGITITTPDKKVYTPAWLNATKQVEWNVAEFNFPEQDGTLVKKSKKLGTKYHLELYFQGEFHLDKSSEFEASLNDSRPIIIAHPFYGSLMVQAPAFHVDNSVLNISKWSGVVIETILESNPKTKVDPIDAIAIQKLLLDESFAQALTAPATPIDVATTKATNKANFNLTVPILKIPKEAEQYFNLFNKADAAINTLTASPLLAMRQTIAMLTAPAQFEIGLKNRIDLLNNQFNNLRKTIVGITGVSPKQIYQNFAGSVISSICLATSLPLAGDFTNRTKSLQIIDTVLSIYNQYIADLDSLQSINGGNVTSYIPDAIALTQLNQLFNLAISNLFTIALNSKTERSIIVENDTNIIILTHRFYGLDNQDNNINELIANNELGLSDLIHVRKGTKIVYYI